MLRTFSDNPTCRHIIFGGCHDAGYLLNLDQFKHNEAKASRITLLETTPAYRGFADLQHFKRANFDDVFKNEPLSDSAPAPAINTVVAAAQSPPPSAHPTITRSSTNKTPPAASVLPGVNLSPGTPAPSVTATESSEDSTWASVGKTVNERTNSAPTAPGSVSRGNTKKKYAYFNKKDERLDEPLPARDSNSAQALDARMKKTGKKMCNNFHLGGSCTQGAFCYFQHEPRLPVGELIALRYKARSLACNNHYCEDIDCCKHSRLLQKYS